ncbi:MAG TPA: ferritin-like domain-containing protein [Solirubrobacterales bacterium]|nr:ferritin-like domain-containing protein [Solirubrobacterales bacterium]
MARKRITWGGAALAVLLISGILAGCGGGGTSTVVAVESASSSSPSADDAQLLDRVLSRQEAAVEAFAAVGPSLPPRLARMAAYFRAQEQEHVDAVLKALRGLGSPAEPTPEPIDASGLASERARLVFLYEVESATIDEELSAISKLEAPWPRSLLASTVADQAQHLTLLRQALGAGPLASVPVPFENGTAEAPGE